MTVKSMVSIMVVMSVAMTLRRSKRMPQLCEHEVMNVQMSVRRTSVAAMGWRIKTIVSPLMMS